MTAEEIKTVIKDALLEHYNSLPEHHDQHHAWIAAKIEAEGEKIKAYKEMRKTARDWSIVAILTTIAANLNWSALVSIFKH